MGKAKKTKDDPNERNPRVAEIEQELDELDAKRLAIKEKASRLMKERTDLLMRDQLVARILTDSAFSAPELDWITDNPEEWKKIKAENKERRGSRKMQQAKATR